jgi:SAM-dependent methyltransferase
MASALKLAAKNLTPPVLWNTASYVKNALFPPPKPEYGQKDSAWYNRDYRETTAYHSHYTASRYYFIWTVIADRLLRAGVSSVLDIGCGAGQIASFLRDRGLPRYFGLDLSEEAVRRAKRLCPEYDFLAMSVFETDVIETHDYDAAISLEFLEHVEEDIGVLRRIPQGRRFIGSVPNFPYVSHVRHFAAADEVAGRYGALFEEFRVDTFLEDDKGIKFFLFEGLRSH